MKRLSALLLALALVFALAGCAAVDSMASPLTEKVEEMLARFIAGDEDGSYALFYPGVTEKDAYHDVFLQICDYFPIKEGYSLSAMSVRTSKGIGNGAASRMEGQYQIDLDGTVYYLFVTYVADADGSGFQQFRVVSKAEYDGLQAGAKAGA